MDKSITLIRFKLFYELFINGKQYQLAEEFDYKIFMLERSNIVIDNSRDRMDDYFDKQNEDE